ncbi:nucleoprotein TPR-like [Sycon ciliatum]|uniref:nucleoprotein TPR-like n=1 Tax=Sycon ciliatum TaxID=27933 RepID=UPI0031F6FF8A
MEGESATMIPDALAEALSLTPADLENLTVNEDCMILLERFASIWGDHNLIRASWNEDLSSLKADLAQQQLDSAEKLSDLEQQLVNQLQQLSEESSAKEQLSGQLSLSVAENEQFKDQLQSSQDELQKQTQQLASLQHDNEQAELDKRQLTQIAELRSGEIERVNAEWKDMSEKLTAALAAKVEAETKVEETATSGMTGQLREKRLEQEKEMLASQIEWLNAEVKTKSDELLASRKEKSTLGLELRTNLNTANDELAASQTTCEKLRELLQERENKVESCLKQVKDLQDEKIDLESQFKNELAFQTKLATLHQETAAEAKQKLDSLVDGARSLQDLLAEASQGREEAEEQLKAREEVANEKIESLESTVSSLERELENANDLLNVARQRGHAPLTSQQVTGISPHAASTSTRLKSGMTLTQIYSMYVEASDDLRVQQDENQQLATQLNQIGAELREKAPMLEQMQREYEDAITTNQKLSAKVEAGILECERLRQEADDSVRLSSQLKRENARMEVRCKDTSQQVRVLLREVEQARGGLSTTSAFDTTLSQINDDVTSSDEVISAQLVSFRNIEELQIQNEKLLAVVRELSEKQEEDELKQRDTEFDELRASHEDALLQLEDLRQQRARSKTVMEALVKQRDLYRVLAQSSSPDAAASVSTQLDASRVLADVHSPVQSLSSADVSMASLNDSFQQAPPPIAAAVVERDVDTTALQDAMEELAAEFREYKEQTGQNAEVLTSQVDQYREEASQAKMDNAKLVSKLEYAVERQDLLNTNVDSYRTELEATRQKNNQMNVAMAKLQMSLDTASQDLVDSKDKLRRSERQTENLTQENHLVKSTNDQMQREIDSLHREQSNQRTLLASLQTIQNNVERNDFEMRTRLAGQLETAQEELTAVRRRLDADTEYHRSVVAAYEVQLKEVREELGEERKQANGSRDELSAVKTSAAAAVQKAEEYETQLKALQAELDAIKERTERAAAEGEGAEVARLSLKLTQAEARCTGLEEQLKRAQQHVDQFKAISEANEQALTELNQANDEFRQRHEEQVAAAVAQREDVEQRLLSLQQDHEKLVGDNVEVEKRFQQEILELREQVSKTATELSTALQAQSAAESLSTQARNDLQLQQTRATQAQDRYERELVLHAASMKELTTIREQLQALTVEATQLTDRAERAEQELSSTVSKYTERLAAKDESLTQADAKCKDWEEQSQLLHQQLEKLGAQVITLQSRLASTSTSTSPSKEQHSVTAQRSSTDQNEKELREIIRFIRHEKDIAETKAELSRAESSRFSQRCEHLDRQVQSLRESLDNERHRAQLHAETASHHAEIMEKVQTLHILQDSNKLLREDRDRLQQRVVQMEAKSKQLEDEICPLKENNHQLTAAREALVAERAALKTEVQRWNQRCNSLMEQCNKVDQEEYQQLLVTKETNQKEISSLNASLAELKESVNEAEAANTALRGQCALLEKKCDKAKEDISKQLELKVKEIDSKTKELADTRKTLLDSRRAGMRNTNSLKLLQTKAIELEAALTAERNKQSSSATASEGQIKELNEQVAKLASDIETAQRNEKEANVKATEQEGKMEKLREMISKLRKQSQQHQDKWKKSDLDLTLAKKQVEETEGRLKEVEKDRSTLLMKVTNLSKMQTRNARTIRSLQKAQQGGQVTQGTAATSTGTDTTSTGDKTTTVAAAPAVATATCAVTTTPSSVASPPAVVASSAAVVTMPTQASSHPANEQEPAAAETSEQAPMPQESTRQDMEEEGMSTAAAMLSAAGNALVTNAETQQTAARGQSSDLATSTAAHTVESGLGADVGGVATSVAGDEDQQMDESDASIATTTVTSVSATSALTSTAAATTANTSTVVPPPAMQEGAAAASSSSQTPTVVVRPASVASASASATTPATSASSAAATAAAAALERTNTPTASIRPMPTPVTLPPTAAVAPTPLASLTSVFAAAAASAAAATSVTAAAAAIAAATTNTAAATTTTVSNTGGVSVTVAIPSSVHSGAGSSMAVSAAAALPPVTNGALANSSVVQQAESTTAEGTHHHVSQAVAGSSQPRGAKRQHEADGQEASSSSVEAAATACPSTEGQSSAPKRRRVPSDDDSTPSATSSAGAVSTSAVGSSSTVVSMLPSAAAMGSARAAAATTGTTLAAATGSSAIEVDSAVTAVSADAQRPITVEDTEDMDDSDDGGEDDDVEDDDVMSTGAADAPVLQDAAGALQPEVIAVESESENDPPYHADDDGADDDEEGFSFQPAAAAAGNDDYGYAVQLIPDHDDEMSGAGAVAHDVIDADESDDGEIDDDEEEEEEDEEEEDEAEADDNADEYYQGDMEEIQPFPSDADNYLEGGSLSPAASVSFGLDIDPEASMPGDEVTSSMPGDMQKLDQGPPPALQAIDDLISTASSSAAPSPAAPVQQDEQGQWASAAAGAGSSQAVAASSAVAASATSSEGATEPRSQPVYIKRGLRRRRINQGQQQDDTQL